MITKLEKNEVFVFGSNESGIHGGGAALQACKSFGAKWNKGFGFHFTPMGRTFAIPTKDWNINSLTLDIIELYVYRFIEYTKTRDDLVFLVTEIGCGLAGYTPEDIAPMFEFALNRSNIVLPERFIKILKK
tara:strand:- start:31738 stop:32130 length:393 start_codon:yes stop_codon:yes gene_type:complete